LSPENFVYVKSLKLLDSFHIKYPTIAIGYMPVAKGPHWIRKNPTVNRPEAVRSWKFLPGVNTKLGTASSIYNALAFRWSS
jgi:hypothetical protein